MTSAWIPLKNVAETSHSQVELFDSVISRFITMEMGKNAIDQIEQSTLKQWIPGLSCHKNRNDIMIDKAILDPLLRSYNLPFFFQHDNLSMTGNWKSNSNSSAILLKRTQSRYISFVFACHVRWYETEVVLWIDNFCEHTIIWFICSFSWGERTAVHRLLNTSKLF